VPRTACLRELQTACSAIHVWYDGDNPIVSAALRETAPLVHRLNPMGRKEATEFLSLIPREPNRCSETRSSGAEAVVLV